MFTITNPSAQSHPEDAAKVSPPVPDTDPSRQAPTTRLSNETIDLLMRHRSIRQFQDKPVGEDIIETLLDVARRAATYAYHQQVTFIRVTDVKIRDALAKIGQQPYIGGDKGELVIFVADLYRNARIRQDAGASTEPLERYTAYHAAVADVMISAQNYVVAAESLGLGTVYLGCIGNDPAQVIKLLSLPALTFPIVGVLVGHPAQEPQFKPRLPKSWTVGENAYPQIDTENAAADLQAYDAEVARYYDMRDLNRRVDTFSTQIATKLGNSATETAPFRQVFDAQGVNLH
ncbi:MAG: NADPH-dependent oxidoreductase [Actinomycetaceae bacterium]|nr:NADPH-dependent oxidoreductase [Actinomycetaceae bacterium]